MKAGEIDLFPFGVYLSNYLYLLGKEELEYFCISFYKYFGVFLRNKKVVKIWLMKGKFIRKKAVFASLTPTLTKPLNWSVSQTGFQQSPKVTLSIVTLDFLSSFTWVLLLNKMWCNQHFNLVFNLCCEGINASLRELVWSNSMTSV